MRHAYFLLTGLLIATIPLAQAQLMGGGMGGGMGGRPMSGGMANQQMSPQFKPQLPNIAGDMANRETKWLKENLALDKEQGKAVKSLNNEYGKLQQEAIREVLGTGGGRPTEAQTNQIRDAMMMYNEEKEDKLRQLITPEQWNTYQAKKDDMQREIGGIRPPAKRPATPPPADSTKKPTP